MVSYLKFSLLFFVIHFVCYIIAGVIDMQLVRGILMSVVLYPILPFLGELSFGMQFFFMGGLMSIYADFSSAIPFSKTVEGLVYLKKEFVEKRVFWTIQLEAILYSILFGLLSAWPVAIR